MFFSLLIVVSVISHDHHTHDHDDDHPHNDDLENLVHNHSINCVHDEL